MKTPAIAKIWLSLLVLTAMTARGLAGTWVPLTSTPPLPLGHIILMSDGTVLGVGFNAPSTATANWYKLTPDINGSYQNGTWSSVASMTNSRLYFSSAVVQDGRLFVAGGEYGTGGATAEIYNSTNNTWTTINPPLSMMNAGATSPTTGGAQGFVDAECTVLPNGTVLEIPIAPATGKGTLIYYPATNGWAVGPSSVNWLAESGSVKLPDGSLITIDPDTLLAERYLPSLNVWQAESNAPASLWASLSGYVGETGPPMLLPNQKAIFFGGAGHTALYTPTGNTNKGSWAQGPDIPGGLVSADAPGAVMPNGKVLFAAASAPYISSGQAVFPPPTTFFEYDYTVGTTGAITQVSAPGGATFGDGSYTTMLLDLPDGNVLFAYLGNAQLWIYQPDGTPLAAGKPTIATLTTNADGSYHLTGTLFNGLSAGSAYGDDHQMDSNFPIVRFTDVSGHVRYGRTYNWSSTGVATGSSTVSVDCKLPAGASSTDIIQVVANGIASDGISLVVANTADSGAGSLRQVVNFLPAGSTVTFAAGLSGQTIKLTSGEIDISKNLTIDGTALANGIRLDGNHASRIMGIGGGANVVLNSLVFTNGYTTNGAWGGAIFNGANLTLNNCTFVNNAGDSSIAGGAIANQGPLTVTGCTLSGNSAGFSGAIDNRSTCNLQNSTFYGNSAFAGNGGAIDNPYGAVLSVLHCTFYGNTTAGSGGAIDNYQAQVNVTNSILAGNGADLFNWPGSTLVTVGVNIIPVLANAGIFIPYGPILTSDPLLGPLANNGGPTKTMVPQLGSPAIDAGLTSADGGLLVDQRGLARVIGDAVDIGAVEATIVPYVFNVADAGYGSLRYAINYSSNNSTITFAPGLSGQTIGLASGEMDIYQNLTIDASTLSNSITLNGNHASRIMGIGGANVVLKSLVFTNGYTTNGNWGGALFNGGTLTLNNCTFAGNSGDSTIAGGAIANQGPLTATGCTFSGNSAGFSGAIDNRSTCSLRNSTFYGNSAFAGNGGAIDNPYGATLSVLHCTFYGNTTVGSGGGIDNYQAQVNVTNSILAGNGSDLFNWNSSTVVAGGANIIPVLPNAGILIPSGPILTSDPLLGPLANNGGLTKTMVPQVGSPAINAGVTSADGGLLVDQRGLPRVVGSAVDIGAVESQIIVSTNRALLAGSTVLSNRAFRFSFTNITGASFTILASTNIALPVNSWSSLGAAVESPVGSGHFQFTDLQATNSPRRFYRVRSP